MKYIRTFEKYIHTKQDEIDDMSLINEFVNKFDDMFECRLNLEGEPIEAMWIGYGAYRYYTGSIILDNSRILKKKVIIRYNVTLTTHINPDGITGEHDIGRTFSINFEINNNRSRNVNALPKFYSYSIDMNELLEKFERYIINTFGIRRLTKEEEEECKLKKDTKKYNL